MPIDYTIPLKAGTGAQTNPLQSALQAAQFRMASLHSQALQQGIDANNAASQAFKESTDANGNTDYNKFRSIMASGAGAYNLPQINNSILEAQQKQQTLDTGKLEQSIKTQTNLRQGLGSLMQKPDLSPNDVLGFMSTQLQAGAVTPQVVAAEMQSMPSDPGQLRQWLTQHYQSALQGETQMRAMFPQLRTINTGPATIAVNENPMAQGGVGAVGYTVKNGLSPEAASTPTQVGITPGGAPITGTREQFVNQSNQKGGVQTALSPYETASQGKAAEYEQDMNGRARAAANSSHYLNEAQALLQGVKTGGGTEKWRDLAERAQAIGVPRDIVDKIAGGNLGDAQALGKVLMQGAIQQMQSSFNGTGAVANVDAFLKNNPNLNTDPRGIEKMIGFINGMNGAVGKEQQAYRDFINKGGNPADFPAKWNSSTTMRAFTGQIKPVRTGTYNGRKVVQYSDGSVDYQ
ncbi:hypothetical protein [Ralstonia mannitolilytica]|uniref:hypothetical protein n=1 Tax=Ralstonia mannitolilytica TaxID=105219 RepID=UPI000B16EFDD|nr:hypothetical protein [Ralstonia mannitolilytica]